MPQLSVIVPVYNTERYLEKCIDSILSQTFRDLELILCDDGSTDKSGAICDGYRAKDARVKVIHKAGTGVSDTRNVALDHAEGDFIAFIDSDDTIEKDAFSACLQEITTAQADCVCFGYQKVDENGALKFSVSPAAGRYAFRTTEEKFGFLLRTILPHKIGWEVCFRIFRGDIIRRHHIRFHKDNVFGEDLYFTCLYTMYSGSLAVLPDCFYHYYDRSTSAVNARRARIALDEVNSLGYYLHGALLPAFPETDTYFPLMHYFILCNQFNKFTDENIGDFPSYAEHLRYRDFYHEQIESLSRELPHFSRYLDKRDRHLFRGTVRYMRGFDVKAYRRCLKTQKILRLFYKIADKLGK